MINNKIIIGIVGATRGIKDHPLGNAITKLSREVGAEITLRQHILLSGGEPKDKFPGPVHTASMYGSKQAGTINNPSRLISVLRDKEKFHIHLEVDDPKCKRLIIETPFGDERNFINGYIPDVLIAIYGGVGTLSEIAFANYNQIPVVFAQIGEIDTIKELQKYFPDQSSPDRKLKEIMEKTQRVFPFDLPGLLQNTFEFINNSTVLNVATNVKEAIDKAIEASVKRENKLPDHNKLKQFNEEFKIKLEGLSK